MAASEQLVVKLPETWAPSREDSPATTSGRDAHVFFLAGVAGWDVDEMNVTWTKFNGAFSNHVYALKLHSRTESKQFLLRVYGEAGEESDLPALVSREHEIDVFRRLSSASIAPELKASFANGRLEGWIEGRSMTNLRMRELWPAVADAVARFHIFATAAIPCPSGDHGIWRRLRHWLGIVAICYGGGGGSRILPEDFRAELGSPPDALLALREEAAWLEKMLGKYPQDTFCHNDLQHGNVMLLDACESTAASSASASAGASGAGVCLVDFEYAQYGPAQFDVANHFAEWAYDYHSTGRMVDFEGRYPSSQQRAAFVKHYLRARAGYAQQQGGGDHGSSGAGAGTPAGIDAEDAEETAVAAFVEAADCFALVVSLLWVLWGLVQSVSSSVSVDGFDYMDYSRKRIGVYVQDKDALVRAGKIGGVAVEGGAAAASRVLTTTLQ